MPNRDESIADTVTKHNIHQSYLCLTPCSYMLVASENCVHVGAGRAMQPARLARMKLRQGKIMIISIQACQERSVQ